MDYRTTTGYRYDPQTGAHVGTVLIDESPLDAEARRGPDIEDKGGEVIKRGELGEPVWLLPPDVTLIPPPSPEHIFDGHAWVDNGDAYAAALAAAKEAKRAELRAVRDQLEEAGFEYEGVIYDADEKSVRRIQGAAQAAGVCIRRGVPFAMVWKAKDNRKVTFDAVGLENLGLSLAGVYQALHDRYDALSAELMSLDSLAAVEAFTWRNE